MWLMWNSVIEKSIKDAHTESTVIVCKNFVGAFLCSWNKKRDLAIAQAKLGLPKHQLTTELPNSWRSQEKMIQRLTEHKRVISQVLQADK